MMRAVVAAIGIGIAPWLIAGCGGDEPEAPRSSQHLQQDRESAEPGESPSPANPGPGNPTPGNPAPGEGYWDDNGQPVNGGPPGADGSTQNNLTKKYCAQNEDPACPAGSFVGPNAILDPAGGNEYVPCEGTICTNPNHGAGQDPENADSPDNTDPESPDPDCEGTVCTNPNHGGGDDYDEP
ncbi:response regulator [Mycolicibacillus koreensis]|uniref:response regulator n=1 Tax=Mycolicibacillus koreensis TaxID=1069220 RepID=UPI000AEAE1CC|nr:response regulator [Mycolicibacillus koreensis]BBY54889.1 hypothetical protein MKOR_21400 [Mycolicibacillus koreensis]